MNADAIALPFLADEADFFGKTAMNRIAEAVEQLCLATRAVTHFERAHLLDEPPKPEAEAKHKLVLEKLISYSRIIHFCTNQPEFPDKKIAGMMAANLQLLQDKLLIWHSDMPEAEAERLLKEVFNEP